MTPIKHLLTITHPATYLARPSLPTNHPNPPRRPSPPPHNPGLGQHRPLLRPRPRRRPARRHRTKWRDFLDREVTPRFPSGLSVVDVYGQWHGKQQNRPRAPPLQDAHHRLPRYSQQPRQNRSYPLRLEATDRRPVRPQSHPTRRRLLLALTRKAWSEPTPLQ